MIDVLGFLLLANIILIPIVFGGILALIHRQRKFAEDKARYFILRNLSRGRRS